MGEFSKFKDAMERQFTDMTKKYQTFFQTNVDLNVLWEMYLNSFPAGSNEIYKVRQEYDCNCCKSFIRHYGNIVAIAEDNSLVSIWDVIVEDPFDVVSKTLSEYVKSKNVIEVFVSKISKLGTNKNHQQLEDGTIKVWQHFFLELPKAFVTTNTESEDSIKGQYRDSKNVFKRSMEELTVEAGETILDLINQNSLYRGDEFKESVSKFLKFKKEFIKVKKSEIDIWCWKKSINNPVSRIRNTAIGTLLIDLSNDLDLDSAVSKFEKVVAPTNYKRPNTIITKRMIEDAQNKIAELGFENSLGRRYAITDDITVNNVLFVNRDTKNKMEKSVFDDLKDSIPQKNKNFGKTEEISINDFVEKILPTVNDIELMIESKHQNNLMSLIAPKNLTSPSMFKWNNNFSWCYNGDIADSLMKQRVKSAGGKVDGVLRFSIMWNEDGKDQNDLDAYCLEPNRNVISFMNKHSNTSGVLDVDIRIPEDKIAVENITWSNINHMCEGDYVFSVNNYHNRGGRSGFRAEIEYNGQIWSYSYNKELKHKETVIVAIVNFNKTNGIKFIKSLDSTVSSQKFWGLETNKFQKVSMFMLSPNHWDDQKIGNKHYFFMLQDCKNESNPRGFFNEFLKEDLLEHKRVFEALGSKMSVEHSDEQLSGLGFSSTQRNDITVKVSGNFNRTLKINF